MTYQNIAQLAVTGQSLHLLSSTFPTKKKKKKKKVGKMAVDVLVGTSLLRASAANVAAL